MSEDQFDIEENEIPSELETLQARATQMGIKFRSNTGVDRLRFLIDQALNGESAEAEEEPVQAEAKEKKETKGQKLNRLRQEAGKLVRIRVTCMNPNKKNWKGEIVSVGSSALGTYKKFIPFDNDAGWHVPNIIYQELKERKYSTFYTVKGKHGSVRKSRLTAEFAIEVMEPLSEQELKKLAQRQAMAAGTSDTE